jgi:hypothetical protein
VNKLGYSEYLPREKAKLEGSKSPLTRKDKPNSVSKAIDQNKDIFEI